MNNNITTLQALFVTIAVVLTIHACAGTGSLKDENARFYYESMDRMVVISRNAIENKGYAVINIHERNKAPQRTTISFVNRTTAGRQLVSSMQSQIHLAAADTSDAIIVRIDNPNYNFATPTNQRIDHAKILLEEIDRLLE